MNIEDTIGDDGLPVNARAMLNRLDEILVGNECNSYHYLSEENKIKYRKCLWLINQQVYGQLRTINMTEEWEELTEERLMKEKVLYIIVNRKEVDAYGEDNEDWDLGLNGLGCGDHEKHCHYSGSDKAEFYEVCRYEIGEKVTETFIEEQIAIMKKKTPSMGYFIS